MAMPAWQSHAPVLGAALGDGWPAVPAQVHGARADQKGRANARTVTDVSGPSVTYLPGRSLSAPRLAPSRVAVCGQSPGYDLPNGELEEFEADAFLIVED